MDAVSVIDLLRHEQGRERGGNFVGRGGLPTSNGFHSPLQMQKRFQMGSEGKGERDIGDGAPIFIADRGISDP